MLRNKDLILTVSYIEVYENKLKDNFNYENTSYSTLKIQEYEDEVSLEKVNEIQIKEVEHFDYLMKLAHDKADKLNKLKAGAFNELFTIKIYSSKKGQNVLISKLNYFLFKAFTIENISINKSMSTKPYSINTKENYNFFNSLNTNSFRLCKSTRILKVVFINI
jgi:hypothetical protein